jgi:hypothetical protein
VLPKSLSPDDDARQDARLSVRARALLPHCESRCACPRGFLRSAGGKYVRGCRECAGRSTSGEVSSPRGSHRADRPGPSSEPVLGRIAGTIKDLPAAELSRLVLPLAGTCGKSSSTW